MRDNPYSGGSVKTNIRIDSPSRPRGTTVKSTPLTMTKYRKPEASKGLPDWFKEIRSNSDFMPSDIKPASYTYMTQAETPFRAQTYAAAAQTTQMDVGTKYHRPSNDVATEIKKNFTIWQDIKNLGGKVKQHGASLLTRLGDVFSRGGYTIRNMYLNDLQMNYMTANSRGGEEVTAVEKAMSYVDMLFLGANRGQLDDTLAAGWRGLSGKDKTSTTDILKVVAPTWSKEHSTALEWVGVAGDIILDPITWVTMGINPGSVTRAGVAGTKLLRFDKAGAAKVMQDTVFTKAGRAQTAATFRSDALQREANALLRKSNRAAARADKAAANSFKIKAGKKQAEYYKAKADEFSANYSQFIATDLKGAALAKLAIKQNVNPLVAMNTASRFTTGAKAPTAFVKANETVKDAMDAYHLSIVDKFKNDPDWINAYESMKGQDVIYKHGRAGESYTVKLSEAKDFKDWMMKVVQEAVPVAKMTEHGPKAARSRMGRIGVTEARSRDFINSFATKHSDVISNLLTGDARWHFANRAKYTRYEPSNEEISSNAVLKISEEQAAKMTAEELKDAAKAAWKQSTPEDLPYPTYRHNVIIVDDAGKAEVINLKAHSRFSRMSSRKAGSRAAAGAKAEARTAQEKAVDSLSGVDDTLAARRVEFVDNFEEFNARGGSSTLDDIVDGESTADAAKVKEVMSDESLPVESRVEALANDPDISDEVVEDLIEHFFNIKVNDEGKVLIHQSKGQSKEQLFENIPEVVKAVLVDRWNKRVALKSDEFVYLNSEGKNVSPMIAASRIQMRDGKLYVDGRTPVVDGEAARNLTRDVNAEIAMGYMDGLRAGLDYAVRQGLMQDNPALMMETLLHPLGEFLNQASADTKAQVMHLVYQMSGMRIPEKLVPTIKDVDRVLDPTWDLTGTASGTKRAWQNLGIRLQESVLDLFGDHVLQGDAFRTNIKPGSIKAWDVDRMGVEIEGIATAKIKEKIHPKKIEKHNEEIAKIEKLKDFIKGESTVNGTTPNVNNYTFLDFLIHHHEIMKSQETTLKIDTVNLTNKATKETQPFQQRRINSGRLSALDSFAFIDPEVKEGLEALGNMRRLARNPSGNPEGSALANQALAQLFLDNGGREFLASVSDPYNPDLKFHFKSMGMQARLKEGAWSNNDFGPKLAGKVMEELWGGPSFHTELQKALGNAILGRIVLKGHNEHTAAKDIIKSLDEGFANHERFRKLLHPVVNRQGGPKMTSHRRDAELANMIETSEGRARNTVDASMNDPRMAVEVPQVPTKRTAKVWGNSIDAAPELVNGIRQQLGFNIPEGATKIYKPYAKTDEGLIVAVPSRGKTDYYFVTKDEPIQFHTEAKRSAPDSPSKVREFFVGAQAKIEEGDLNVVKRDPRSHDTNVNMIPGSRMYGRPESRTIITEGEPNVIKAPEPEAAPTPTAATPEPEAVPEAKPFDPEQDVDAVDPEDFANMAEPNGGYTEEELAGGRAWIAKEYADTPPSVVARELHRINVTMAMDLFEAQLGMADTLKNMNITNKANVRFMGVPFMPVFNPINGAHSVAGVTAFNESRSRAFNFWNKILSSTDVRQGSEGALSGLRTATTRQSQLLDAALNQILTTTVNAVAISKRKLVQIVNTTSARLVGEHADYQFANASVASMTNKQKWARANELFFDPKNVRNKDWMNEFDEVQGSNPLKDIEAHMDSASRHIFRGGTKHFEGRIKDMNRFIGDRRLKIKDQWLDTVVDMSHTWFATDGVLPYTREWFARLSTIPLMEGPFSAQNIKNVNLTKLHMGVQNAALRIEEGATLHRGIWDEFSFIVDPKVAAYWNESLVPQVTRDNGEALRGKLVPLQEVYEKRGIKKKYIPEEFLDPEQGVRYVQEEFIKEIKIVAEFMDEMSETNNLIDTRFMDKIYSQFKANVTIYKIPTYPIRNLITDVFMSAMDGLVSPRYYRDATRIVQNAHRHSKGIDEGAFDFTRIIDDNFMKTELARNMNDPNFKPVDPAVGAERVNLHLKGLDDEYTLSDKQIMDIYMELGLGQNRVSVEFAEAIPQSRRSTGARKVAGPAMDGARVLNDIREDWSRMAHFVYALEMEAGKGGDLMDISRRAAERVIKHHFDYNDISLFERKTLGRLIPFYKWVRNVVPYTIASVVARPYAVKMEQGLTQAIGASLDDNKDDPRTDFVLPDYIERENAVDIGWYSDLNGNKMMQWMSLGLPISDTLSRTVAPVIDPLLDESVENKANGVYGGAARVGLSMVNPVASSLIQAATGRKVWPTGASNAGENDAIGTLGSVLPGTFLYNDMKKLAETAANSGANNTANKNQLAEVLKTLGAIKVQNNSESAQIGELKRLQDMNSAQRSTLTGPIKNKLMKKYPQLTPDQADSIITEYVKQLRTAPNG